MLSCACDLYIMRSKYRRRTLTLIISGDIRAADGLIFMDFSLTGAHLSSKLLILVWHCSHYCHTSALGLVISSNCIMLSSVTALMSMS